jgi:pimeloyl-ACP methyl ester carboxylesterase
MATAETKTSTTGRISIPLPLRSAMGALDLVAPPLAARVARELYFRPRRLSAREAERAVLSKGERFTVSDEGVDVVGRAWGEGNGPVVVLLHGWSGALGQLTPFVEPLVARGFRVVGFDWPAHGDSAGTLASLLHASRVTFSLQRLFGPFHAVVAHSFGAASALYSVGRGLEVKRLVLSAPVARIQRYIDEYSTAFRFSQRQRASFIASCEAWLKESFSQFEPLAVAPLVTQPTLVFHSDDDAEVALEDVRGLSEALRGEFRVVHGLGHRKLLRDERCVEEAVEFVGR